MHRQLLKGAIIQSDEFLLFLSARFQNIASDFSNIEPIAAKKVCTMAAFIAADYCRCVGRVRKIYTGQTLSGSRGS